MDIGGRLVGIESYTIVSSIRTSSMGLGEVYGMDIGTPRRIFTVEPIKSPIPQRQPQPDPTPAVPEREPEREPVPVER